MSMGLFAGESAGFLGATTILAQAIPGIPDDFKSWPVTAIAGLIALAGLAIVFWTMRNTTKSLTEIAGSLSAQTEVQRDTNLYLAESSKTLAILGTELHARPCLLEKKPE